MHITLINPNIVSQKDDFSGSGIPYMPIALSYLAAYLRESGFELTVIDAFGEAPDRIRSYERYFVQGLTADEVVERIPKGTDFICFYAHLVVTHAANLALIRKVREKFAQVPKAVLENINKVNSYSLRRVYQEFFDIGIDYAVLGFLEVRTALLLRALQGSGDFPTEGVICRSSPSNWIEPDDFASTKPHLDHLPFPAWDLFPLKNYWNVGYSHAPFSLKSYLPLLTSRGCPFQCGFCVSPDMSGSKWRARSASDILEEVEHFHRTFGVREFHIEDLNPTVNKKRFAEFCDLLKERDLGLIFKIAQGTKLETLDEPLLQRMKDAGFRYVSISPESGSTEVLKKMNKPVNLEHAVVLVTLMRKLNIYSQACFVIGYPGEGKVDRIATRKLVRRLAKAGLDELALFMITPMPGSRIFEQYREEISSLDRLTFTPVWRKDYSHLSWYRKSLYGEYILIKLFFHPTRFFGYLTALITGRFNTKVEMTIYRKLRVIWCYLRAKVYTVQ